jgi:hypothetical protein
MPMKKSVLTVPNGILLIHFETLRKSGFLAYKQRLMPHGELKVEKLKPTDLIAEKVDPLLEHEEELLQEMEKRLKKLRWSLADWFVTLR